VRTGLPANREEYRDLRVWEAESKANSRKFRCLAMSEALMEQGILSGFNAKTVAANTHAGHVECPVSRLRRFGVSNPVDRRLALCPEYS
jgi:hypothetical protein